MKCSSQLAPAFAASLLVAIPLTAGEWKPLFNGKDLDGWKAIDGPASSWKVEDGLLFCSGQGSGWLSTAKEYGNYELELEFRVPTNGNSGDFCEPRITATRPTRGWRSRFSTTTALSTRT